eukprot:90121-Hanusia_phi.AAC.1
MALKQPIRGGDEEREFTLGLQGAGFSSPVPEAAEGCVNVVLSEGLPDGASYTLKLQKQWSPVFATVSFSLGKVGAVALLSALCLVAFLPPHPSFLLLLVLLLLLLLLLLPPSSPAKFTASQASVDFESYEYSSSLLVLTIGWSVTSSLAHPKDTVKVWNSAGTLCACQTDPGTVSLQLGEVVGDMEGQGTSPQGQKNMEIQRAVIGLAVPPPASRPWQGAVLGGYKLGFFPGGGDVKVAVGDQWIQWK